MKICWDNLEKLRYSAKTGKWYKNRTIYIYMNSCKICKEPFLSISNKSKFCGNSCSSKGRKHTKETKNKISNNRKGKLNGINHPNWKGGLVKKNIPLYNTYEPQIKYAESVRRNKVNKNILEVKCAYCGKWFIPTLYDIWNRIQTLNGTHIGEARLYCSILCKNECPVYKQHYYPKDFKVSTSREVQPELRQMVFKRDNYTCQKCNKHQDELKTGLHCHHVEGIRWEPLESADMDKCLTLCKKCHKKVHKKEGCGYYEMRCIGG